MTDRTDDIFSDSFTKFMIEAKLSRLDSAYVSYRSILDTYSEDTNTHLVKCIRLFLEYKNASRADCVRNNNAIDGSLSAVESIVSKGIAK